MSRLTIITDRALELASQAGDSFKQMVPSGDKLLQTGAALGAMKTGAKVAQGFVRRNPVIAIAAAAGVGLLAYAAYRKRKHDEANAPIEGKSKRVEARRVNNGASRSAAKNTAARRSRAHSSSASTEQ
jgi:uncharacterized membrane protein YebE (DUF533 family)